MQIKCSALFQSFTSKFKFWTKTKTRHNKMCDHGEIVEDLCSRLHFCGIWGNNLLDKYMFIA